MVRAGFLRVFSSGTFLLLLAMTTTTTTLLLQRAGATTSTSAIATTGGTADSCVDAIDACQADETCLICASGGDSTSDILQDECSDAALDAADPQTVSEAICAGFLASLCCTAKVSSEPECFENTAFAEWVICSVGDCAEDNTVCDHIIGTDSGGGDGEATLSESDGATAVTAGLGGASGRVVPGLSCAFGLLLLLLWA
ncbi:unnamed protein product [Laminaria digitata]